MLGKVALKYKISQEILSLPLKLVPLMPVKLKSKDDV